MTKNILETLRERGFVDSVTSEEFLDSELKSLKVYAGFDPTADSLHLGNLVGIIGLAWFQKFGIRPYVLLGGATGRIGDPSGKSVERPLLDETTINNNVSSLRSFFEQILQNDEGAQPVIVDNNNWYASANLINFLRDIGKHFRVGSMIAKDMVKSRINSEEGISYTEFSYQVLQAYDFHYLSQHHGVNIQIGGSDQWGNITAGTELNRKLGGPQLFGLTFPLLTRSDGKKFGKSESGAIWLSSDKFTPYQFYQYLYGMPDLDVIRLLKILTFLDLDEIKKIEEGMKQSDYVPNSAQKILASEVTRFVHGESGLKAALKVTKGMAPGAKATLDRAVLEELAKDMPNATLDKSEVLGKKYVEVAVHIGLLSSKGEAGRLIKNGGAYLNNERIEDVSFVFSEENFVDGFLIMGAGKKKRILVRIL